MITDVQLAVFANVLGVGLFLLVVLYHYIAANYIFSRPISSTMGVKHWREAATVILTARNACDISPYNFKIMTMKRSSGNKFMPGGYVFPGGSIHPSDSDKNWLDLFKKFNLTNFSKLFPITGNIPEILHDESNTVPKSISFRIAAIRETFEESGILLCNDTSNTSNFTNFKSYPNLENWRVKVQKDGYEFLNLCQNFDIYPDIKGLQLWSNWLTPPSEKTKRFDTLFFLASLETVPESNADDTEVENLTWKTPDHIMDIFKKEEIWLPPPQVYEMARILNFKSVEDLYKFAGETSSKGCERWMPEWFKTLNGDVTVLPGDEAYKGDDLATVNKVNEVKLTNEEFRSGFKILHRMEHTDKVKSQIVIKNFEPKYNVLPLTG